MAREHPIELFMPPNMLKAKVGGNITGIDTAAVKRAEDAMNTLKPEFASWIAEDIERLDAAHAAFAANPTDETAGVLFRASHDLKGQGTTFEYPLIARIAASLCKLIESLRNPKALSQPLVEAHVNAIRVVFHDKIKDIFDLTALTLVEELEARVRVALARADAAAKT